MVVSLPRHIRGLLNLLDRLLTTWKNPREAAASFPSTWEDPKILSFPMSDTRGV